MKKLISFVAVFLLGAMLGCGAMWFVGEVREAEKIYKFWGVGVFEVNRRADLKESFHMGQLAREMRTKEERLMI